MPVLEQEIMGQKTRAEVRQGRAEINDRVRRAFTDGVLFSLSIGNRPWTTSLTEEDMLVALVGADEAKRRIEAKEFSGIPKIIERGRMLLLPRDLSSNVDKIESESRRFLDSQSVHYDLTEKVVLRFVLVKRVPHVWEGLMEREQKFWEAVDNVVSNYEDAQQEMFKMYPQFKDKLQKLYPARDAIKGRYYFKYHSMELSFPDSLATTDFRRVLADQKHDEAYFQRLDTRLQAEVKTAENRMNEFVAETIRGLRGEVTEVFKEMLTKVQDGKNLTPTNLSKIRAVITRVKEVDFLNDQSFHQQLDLVSRELADRTEFKDGDSALTALREVLDKTVSFVGNTTDSAVGQLTEAYFSRKLVLS